MAYTMKDFYDSGQFATVYGCHREIYRSESMTILCGQTGTHRCKAFMYAYGAFKDHVFDYDA